MIVFDKLSVSLLNLCSYLFTIFFCAAVPHSTCGLGSLPILERDVESALGECKQATAQATTPMKNHFARGPKPILTYCKGLRGVYKKMNRQSSFQQLILFIVSKNDQRNSGDMLLQKETNTGTFSVKNLTFTIVHHTVSKVLVNGHLSENIKKP